MSENRERQYWWYKVGPKWGENLGFFEEWMKEGWLRGWPGEENDNLVKKFDDFQKGKETGWKIKEKEHRRVVSAYEAIKKGDILMVPYLPDGKIALLKAREDFDAGYKFASDEEIYDGHHRHMFPIDFLTSFHTGSLLVNDSLATYFRYPKIQVGWSNISHLSKIIDRIVSQEDREIRENPASANERISKSVLDTFQQHFNSTKFSDDFYDNLQDQFGAKTWEEALAEALQKLFPSYTVIRTGGAGERNHGTDILVTIPSVFSDWEYAIAIQVKDYKEVVKSDVLGQIERAEYWNSADRQLVDKILIITKAKRDDNTDLQEKAKERNIKVIFAEELKDMLYAMAISYLGIADDYI